MIKGTNVWVPYIVLSYELVLPSSQLLVIGTSWSSKIDGFSITCLRISPIKVFHYVYLDI
jgi:hypothetical protein